MNMIRLTLIALVFLMASSIDVLAAPGKAASSRRKEAKLIWQGGMAEVGLTASFKYQVRAVPDNAGGVILAWEENRYRKACCRDLRDVYLQRFDQSGAPLWGSSDYMAAGEEAGEEIVGLLPGTSGGAQVFWRRDGGMLLTQEVAPSGIPVFEPRGRILSPCLVGCEWNPVEAFNVAPGGKQALATWVEFVNPSQVKSISINRAGDSFVFSSGLTSMTGAGLRSASPVSLGGRGWLVLAWHTREAGSRIAGQLLDINGNPEGREFTLAMNDKSRWMNMECASSGDGALILRSSINPDEMGKSHELFLSQVTRKSDGKPAVSSVKLGNARTSAMYIPPVHVSLETTFTWTGQTEFENVGKENLFWRRTSSMFPDGMGGCVAWWVEGDKIRVTRVRSGESGLSVARSFSIGSSTDIGFTPFIIPMGENRLFLVWAEKRERIYRVLGREISIAGTSPAPIGETIVLQPSSSGAPRWAANASAGNRSAWLTLCSMTNGGNAVQIKLGKLSW